MGLQRVRHDWATCTYFHFKFFSMTDASAPQVALVVKNPPTNAGDIRDTGSVPGSGRSPEEGHGNPLQYSCLENSTDGGAWWAIVHGVAKSQTWLSNFTFPFHFHEVEKEIATHSSVLAWRIPGMEEPGGVPSMGSHRVGHDWRDLAAALLSKVNSKQIYWFIWDDSQLY